MSRFEHHVFVCETQRPPDHPRGCCASQGSADVREAFKLAITQHELEATVRANTAGCLDACEKGTVVVVYPEGVWYGGVTEDDVPEIVEAHLKGGAPVERLRIPASAFEAP